MAHEDEQLIQIIAEQVLELIAQRRGSASPSERRAVVNPSPGTCTAEGARSTDIPTRSVTPQQDAPAAIALTGIITAQQLEEAIAASPQGVALLSPQARLTPLASDYARQFPQKVSRAQAGAAPPRNGATAGTGDLSWLWWADGHCAAVQELTARLSSRLVPSAAPRSDVGQIQAIRDLASAVAGKTVAGGLMFVDQAAAATLYANRCPSLRAIVGTCIQAVEQGVTQLGANLMIIEYPRTSSQEIEAMVAAMIAQPPKPKPHIERDLADLQRGR